MFKVNKKNLAIEEVEQFDEISIEDLVDGVSVTASSYFLAKYRCSSRAAGECPEVHNPVIRVQPQRWEKVLSARARQLGSQNYRDRAIDSSYECLLGFPGHGEIVSCPNDTLADLWPRHLAPPVGLGHLLDKADVSKVIEVRDPGELTKEAIDAKLSLF